MSNKKSATNNIIESLEITKNQRETHTAITTNHRTLEKLSTKHVRIEREKREKDWRAGRTFQGGFVRKF